MIDETSQGKLESVRIAVPQTNQSADHLLVITNAVQDATEYQGSSVVSYGFDGTNYNPIQQTTNGSQLLVAVDTPLPTGTNSIGSVAITGESPFNPKPQLPISAVPLTFGSLTANQLVTIQYALGASGASSENSSVVCYGLDQVGNNRYPIPLSLNGLQVQVAVDKALPTGTNTIGSVGLTSSLNTSSYTQGFPFAPISGPTYDMGDNSLVDIYLTASGPTITAGSIQLDYSANGTTWYSDAATLYTISSSVPFTLIGLKTASRYIRVSTSVTSTFRATGLAMTFSSKRS